MENDKHNNPKTIIIAEDIVEEIFQQHHWLDSKSYQKNGDR